MGFLKGTPLYGGVHRTWYGTSPPPPLTVTQPAEPDKARVREGGVMAPEGVYVGRCLAASRPTHAHGSCVGGL